MLQMRQHARAHHAHLPLRPPAALFSSFARAALSPEAAVRPPEQPALPEQSKPDSLSARATSGGATAAGAGAALQSVDAVDAVDAVASPKARHDLSSPRRQSSRSLLPSAAASTTAAVLCMLQTQRRAPVQTLAA